MFSKAVLKVRNYLKDHKSVTGEVEECECNFQGPIYVYAPRALECSQLRVWRTWGFHLTVILTGPWVDLDEIPMRPLTFLVHLRGYNPPRAL